MRPQRRVFDAEDRERAVHTSGWITGMITAGLVACTPLATWVVVCAGLGAGLIGAGIAKIVTKP
jgi:ammonia channel protein AmtB